MDKYFLTEETRVGTVPHLIQHILPTTIIGYGKHSFDETIDILYEKRWSPLSQVVVRCFDSNREYNQYIRKMRALGVNIKYGSSFN